MRGEAVIFSIFIIFTGAAVLASVALYARQSLLVAYIALGALLGPHGLALVDEPTVVAEIGHVGIMFLLFLLGLNLHPQKLVQLLGEATLVTFLSSAAFALLGSALALAFGFSPSDSLWIGAVAMFSSTIIGLKLLPTTQLHHLHVGEVMISVLLLQDIIAILILLVLAAYAGDAPGWSRIALLVAGLPVLIGAAFVFERYVLIRIMARFDKIHEFIFLLAIGWCLGLAQLGALLGLSYEIGAFIAGVALAYNRIALYIAESLKPLRDFFLVMFFFSLGAQLELGMLGQVLLPALVLALALLLAKPALFRWLLLRYGENPGLAREIGWRLGQLSEFSLLIALLANQQGLLSQQGSYLIQAATVLSFVLSSYWIMLRFPTPIAVSDRLRQD